MVAAFLRRIGLICVLASAGALALVQTSHAQGLPVDLELILAIDCSGSVDEVEAQLQRQGYIAALTSDRVINAIRSSTVNIIFLWPGSRTTPTTTRSKLAAARVRMSR